MATETFTLTLDSIGTNISVDINDTSQTPGYNIAVGHSYSSAYTLSGVDRNGTVSGTVSWTPVNAGTYYYICRYHGGMTGVITVS